MAAMEEVCRLCREQKYDMAAKVALENWGRLTNMEPQERHVLLTTSQPGEQTIMWIAVLISELDQHVVNWTSMLPSMARFSKEFSNQQASHLPQMFCQLFHLFVDSLCTNRKALTGIAIVIDAVKRFAPSETTLTAIHSDLLQLCLAARCLKPCLPFLERDYNDLYNEHGQFECQKVLQFFYYGGMVYTCLHDYQKALQCFTICLCVPAMSISAVMLAGYKKYVLVCLLKQGRLIPLPRCSNDMVERIMRSPARQYLELAKSYTARDQSGVKKVLNDFMDVFVADGNYGLVQRVEKQLSHHAIQRLTMSFLKLPLADAANRIDLNNQAEMEKMIRDMIEDGEVNASISQAEGRVEFLDNGTGSAGNGSVRELEHRLQQCIRLQEQLSAANRQLATDPRYIQKSGGGSSGSSLGMSLGLEDDPLHEEHLL